MPVHQIVVVPAHSLPQGAAQTFTTTSCQETYRTGTLFNSENESTHHISVNHTHITKQQVKHRYRRHKKTVTHTGSVAECVDQTKCVRTRNDSSSEEEYHTSDRPWSQRKARRKRRPYLLTRSCVNKAQNKDLNNSTSLELTELDKKKENYQKDSKEEEVEERPIMRTCGVKGSGNADDSVPTALKNTEMCSQNKTQEEACAENELEVCRICHGEGEVECPLITPCHCIGSLSFVHHSCLRQWIQSSDTRCCELCKYNFIMETQLKPLRKWENLQMSANERRRVFCSVIFHLAAVACVTWSLYFFTTTTHNAKGVQTSKEHNGLLEQLFWIKLGIVALSASSGLIFMYIQCKVYLNMWRRLKAFNRIIFVHNCPDSSRHKPEKTTSSIIGSIRQTQTTTPCNALEARLAQVEPV